MFSEFLSNREPIHSAKLLLAGLFFGLSFATHELSAAAFKFESSLTSVASSIWKTNQLDEPDSAADAETVLTFNPETSMSVSGKQMALNADLGVQHRVFTDTGSSSTTPKVSISALSSFYGEIYTVGALARSSGRIENANASVDVSVDDFDEIPVDYDFEIQQFVSSRLGSNAVLRVRHTSAISQSTVDTDIGSNAHTLQFLSDALLTRTGVIGGIRGGYQLTNYENDTKGFNSTLTSELHIPVSAAVTIDAAAGYEWYRSDETGLELAGEVAFFGFSWRPIKRLSAELGYGRRIFGQSPHAKISYTARRSGLSLTWTRDLQSYKLSDVGEELDAITIDANASDTAAINADAVSDEEVLDFNGLDSSAPFLDQQRSINEIVTLQMFFNTLRTSYSAVFAFVESEEIEESSINKVSQIARLQASRKFGQSFDIGLEGALSSEVDESDIRSTRRKISIFSKWKF